MRKRTIKQIIYSSLVIALAASYTYVHNQDPEQIKRPIVASDEARKGLNPLLERSNP